MSLSPKSLIFLSVVLVAGVLGAIAAYRIAVPASSPQPAPRESLVVDSSATGAEEGKARAGRRAEFAPCRKPARLEGGTCVTDVVRTVTVPGQSAVAAAPPPASAPAPAPASAPVSSSGGDDHGHHHGGDDDGDDDHGHHGGEGEDGHHHGGDDDDDDDHSGHGHGGDDHDDDHDDDDDDDDD